MENASGISVQNVDHIGVAVDSINDALPLYNGLFDLDVMEVEDVESEQVRTARLDAGNTNLELLEPLDDGGPIQKFLTEEGPGVHHICFEVEDVDSTLKTLREAGYEPIYDESKVGARQKKINFLHPNDTNGVLIELQNKSSKKNSAS